MRELREHNENMLRNILPSHVARHFLEKDRDNEVLTHIYTAHARAVKVLKNGNTCSITSVPRGCGEHITDIKASSKY